MLFKHFPNKEALFSPTCSSLVTPANIMASWIN